MSDEKTVRVIIGIQCRSNSERLPNKALMEVGGKTIIERIINTCYSSSRYIAKQKYLDAYCRTLLLIPRGDDKLINALHKKIDIIEGSEDDVLARYVKAANTHRANYIVRITGDCLFIPPNTISRHIKQAIITKADYCSNILERTSPEGWDTEVISRKLLHYLDEHSDLPHHREHVTALIPELIARGKFRNWNVQSSLDFYDMSELKTSIDTEAEYEKAVNHFRETELKKARISGYGQSF